MMEPPGAPRNNNGVSCAPEFSLGGGELKAAAAGEERSPTLVFVRLRPMSEEEKGSGSMSSIEVVNNTDVYLTSDSEPDHHRLPGRHFRFDATFPDTATQEQVYAASTAHLLEGVLQGGNGTVFCYGATGTGKTYTMLGTLENPGLMMLAIKDLFSNVGRSGHHGNHSIQLSYLEVHNEVIKDLLSPGRRLLLRQDGKGTVVVGLNHYTAHSAEEAIKLLQQGNRNRTTEPPRVNERPHAILQVIVEYRSMYKGSISQVGKLSLIDLAGSESALFALKTCINDPVEGKKRRPYRSTKLAQLLKDSIEGSHNIVMITNINPSNVSFCETQNTLYWADRAKLLKTKACSAANKEAVKLVLELQDGDSGLQIEAFSTGADRETVHVPDSATDVAKISLEKENVVLAAENAELRQKVKILEAEIVKMKEHHLVQLEKQADIAEARLGNQRVGIQHTCTHFLDLPEDCITDILLRLPQDSPSCLLRASLVCKSLLSIVSDPGFLRVLRALHPTPHLSGFFEDQVNPKSVPTTAFAFSLPAAMPRGGCYAQSILDCRHSRALFLVYGPSMVLLVWELVTGKRKYVPMPVLFESAFYVPPSGAVVCAADDCDHRGCHCHGGHFFLVLASPTMYDDIGSTRVWVYSSETGAWSEPYLVEMAYSVSRAPSTLVGRTVYLGLGAFEAGCALEYDLVRHDLAVFEIPSDLLVLCDGNIIIIPAEDGRLGLASVKDSSLSLWLCDDNACWTAHRVIDLDIPAREGYINIRGFAEGVNIIFVSVDDDDGVIFAIEIKSERVRRLGRLFEPPSSEMIFPLVSF